MVAVAPRRCFHPILTPVSAGRTQSTAANSSQQQRRQQQQQYSANDQLPSASLQSKNSSGSSSISSSSSSSNLEPTTKRHQPLFKSFENGTPPPAGVLASRVYVCKMLVSCKT
jgi:hypothetical protein